MFYYDAYNLRNHGSKRTTLPSTISTFEFELATLTTEPERILNRNPARVSATVIFKGPETGLMYPKVEGAGEGILVQAAGGAVVSVTTTGEWFLIPDVPGGTLIIEEVIA